MRSTAVRIAGALCAALALCSALQAQSRRDPITDAEEEQIRDATDRPAERLKVYATIISARVEAMAAIAKSTPKPEDAQRIHNLLEDYTKLVDELQANFDEYESYETNQRFPVPDMRKTLPKLKINIDRWIGVVNALPSNDDYNFAKETATDANASLRQSFTEFDEHQTKYFREHKPKAPTEDPNLHSPDIR